MERTRTPPDPPYGFHGREDEIRSLERAFFSSGHRIVILHGRDGRGKTALAAEAGRRFVNAGLFARAAFVSFEGGGDLDLAIGELSPILFGDGAIPSGDLAWEFEEGLRETPTLIVFDNFEALLQGGDAPLEAPALYGLLEVAHRWAGAGGSRLLITTRDPDLPHEEYAPSLVTRPVELGGLSLSGALELALAMLDALEIPPPEREGLERLVDLLGCHPLSIQMAVPHVKEHSPERLIDEFDRLLPGFASGAGKQNDHALEAGLTYVFKRLSPEVQTLLPSLGIFRGGAMEKVLLRVTGLGEGAWQEARRELVKAALISVEQISGVRDVFLHFHPALVSSLRRRLSPEQQGRLEHRFSEVYRSFASFLYGLDPKAPSQARETARRELPNVTRALDLALDAEDREVVGDLAIPLAYFLDLSRRWRERDELMKRMERQVRRSEGPLTPAELFLLSRTGETPPAHGKGAEATEPYETSTGGESSGAFGDVLPKLQQFEPVIQGVLSACRGNEENRRHIEELCAQMEQTPEGGRLARVFLRLLGGERGEELLDGLSRIEAAIVGSLLERLRA